MKKIISSFLVIQFLMISLGVNRAVAQEDSADDILKNTQNDIFLVAGAGVGGAILGLSTLSFVDRPSQHISNIWTGAALGIIAGVLFVAYNSAQKGSEELQSSSEFNSSERLAWHTSHSTDLTSSRVQYGTQFWSLSF